MKTLKSAVAAILVLPALVSCRTDDTGRDVTSVKFSEVKTKAKVILSRLVDEPEFIALDSSCPEAYSSGYNFYISDNYIGIEGTYTSAYKLYDRKSGKYLRDIGKRGRGPGEYFAIYSSVIDEKNSIVYLLPWNAESVMAYDMTTGFLKEEYPLKYFVPKGKMSINSENGDITIAALPFENQVPMVAWQQDMDGNVKWEIPAGHLALEPDYSHELLNGRNTDEFDLNIHTWGGRPDSLYVLDKGTLKPVYTVDFAVPEPPMHSYTMLPDYFLTAVNMWVRKPNGRRGVGKTINIVTDRKTGKSVHAVFYDDYMCKTHDDVSFLQGYYMKVYEPDEFMTYGKKAIKEGNLSQEAKRKISSILEDLSDDSNSVIVLAPLKDRNIRH